MRHAAIILCLALAVQPAAAETVIHEEIMGQGGLVCDSLADVHAYITLVEAGENPQDAAQAVEGCGFLQKPVVMKVTALSKFEQGDKEFLIVRYDFKSVSMPLQYGVGAVRRVTRS